MKQEYFSIQRNQHSYRGALNLSREVKEKWTELPEKVTNLDGLQYWLTQEGRRDQQVYVLLVSIWSGLDVTTLKLLIDQSKLSSDVLFYYRLHEEDSFRIDFNPEDKNEIVHSPILLVYRDKALKCYTGLFDRAIISTL